MSTILHSRPAALLRSTAYPHPSDALSKLAVRVSRSRALVDLLPSLFVSGVLTAIAVAALQLTWSGPVSGFGTLWLENWMIAWPIAFPIAYFAGPTLMKLAHYVSSPAETAEVLAPGLAFGDIVSASSRATERHGFTVLRNLKVREDFSRA